MAYKHDYDKILTRLTIILKRLNEGEELSIKELAEEFNVSERTIHRDFNERLIHFPIYKENRKWKMQEGFKLEKSRDLEENIILDILEKIAENIGGKFALKANNLLSKLKNHEYNPIYAKLNIEDISDKLKEISLLEEAIKNKIVIKFKYTDYYINVEPLKIANYEGFWYLIGTYKNQIKKYYLKNISDIKLSDKTFEIPQQVDELLENSISVWFEKKEPFEVKLLAHKYIAKYFKRKPLPTQTITSLNSDGSIEFTIKITHEMEILPIIKYWIPYLEVISPQFIKDILIKQVEEFLGKIKGNKI